MGEMTASCQGWTPPPLVVRSFARHEAEPYGIGSVYLGFRLISDDGLSIVRLHGKEAGWKVARRRAGGRLYRRRVVGIRSARRPSGQREEGGGAYTPAASNCARRRGITPR